MAKDVMNKVRLGRTDLMVTPICFGTGGLGDMPDSYGYSAGAERAKATVQAILDGPVNFIDTSRNYGIGRSEERIGAVVRERGGLPAGFVVSTKLDRDFDDNGFDAARARRSLEAAWTELLAAPSSTDDPEATRDYKLG
jgi:D-threo-aldose 1-dehydrogenase